MNTGNLTLVVYCSNLAVQQKMSEEIGARMRAESRVVEVEKQCSMLEFDLKQSVQKMEQLMKQKERLEDEARVLRRNTRGCYWGIQSLWHLLNKTICHLSRFPLCR